MKKLSAYTYPHTIQQRTKYSAEASTGLKNFTIRVLLVLHYLYACLRHRVVPWNFFQLNSKYFNEAKGIYSKLEMDIHIPHQWKLKQYYFDQDVVPEAFPVFLKPEWGQNALGIACVRNEAEYQRFASHAGKATMPYIVQQAASGRNEFEIFYLRSPQCSDDCAVLSITQVTNIGEVDNPINSIHNPRTIYVDITPTFSEQELQNIWNYSRTVGNFRMARICIKVDSKEDLLRGIFQIVEINLFLPMPLVLLAKNVSDEKKLRLLKKIMIVAARLVKTIPAKETGKSIFFRKMKAHHRILQWKL